MDAVGIILSNMNDGLVAEMTKERTMSAMPFGGRYRMIDFVLSSMASAGICRIGVATNENYHSLMNHLGTGRDWQIPRKRGGLSLLPPYSRKDYTVYQSRLQALNGLKSFIELGGEEYVVIADGDNIYNLPFKDVLAFHKKTGSELTAVGSRMDFSRLSARERTIFETDENGRVRAMKQKEYLQGMHLLSLNTWVIGSALLTELLQQAQKEDLASFVQDVVGRMCEKRRVFCYVYDGYYGSADSLSNYLMSNLDLLDENVRASLFDRKGHPVYTRSANAPSTKYLKGARVINALIGDGCIIEGEVVNAVLSCGVHIKSGSIVENSVLMDDVVVENGAHVHYVVADKRARISEGATVAGYSKQPLYIKKSGTVLA